VEEAASAPEGSEDRKFGGLYASFMDSDRAEALGSQPISEALAAGKPVNRDEWFMASQTVNAYYNPCMNKIVFPAAALQDPFFDPDRDDAANYGAVGAFIGHEIGHSFDEQGSKYDGDGRLTDWWSTTDRQAFEARTRSLIGQYNALAPKQAPDQHANGPLTIGENIGDLDGLGIAWQAHQVSLHGQEAPVIDGLTGAQRFFLSWARVWRERTRTRKSSGCSPSTSTLPTSSAATRSYATSTSSTPRLTSAPPTNCGSNPRPGSASGKQEPRT
jgi:predicted metalloendopeptidase